MGSNLETGRSRNGLVPTRNQAASRNGLVPTRSQTGFSVRFQSGGRKWGGGVILDPAGDILGKLAEAGKG